MYTFNKTLDGVSFEEAVARAKDALTVEGFGILTEIDVKKTMKAKLDAEIGGYLILGACNPKMAYRAIELEPRVGAMLPCNVIVRALANGAIEISAINPVASMQAISNAALHAVAGEVATRLQSAIDAI
ncbi:MAG: DUF302 domain-containing protein [Devosia sp.]